MADEFMLVSADVAGGVTVAERHVYAGFGCTGGNLSPQFAWQGAPAATQSFALTLHDPDAPRPGGWWHWLVFNIPATATGIDRGAGSPGSGPAGSVQSLTSFGTAGYGGPCPPVGHGLHHYLFTVHALDTVDLGMPATAAPEEVAAAIRQHTLAVASLTAVYQR